MIQCDKEERREKRASSPSRVSRAGAGMTIPAELDGLSSHVPALDLGSFALTWPPPGQQGGDELRVTLPPLLSQTAKLPEPRDVVQRSPTRRRSEESYEEWCGRSLSPHSLAHTGRFDVSACAIVNALENVDVVSNAWTSEVISDVECASRKERAHEARVLLLREILAWATRAAEYARLEDASATKLRDEEKSLNWHHHPARPPSRSARTQNGRFSRGAVLFNQSSSATSGCHDGADDSKRDAVEAAADDHILEISLEDEEEEDWADDAFEARAAPCQNKYRKSQLPQHLFFSRNLSWLKPNSNSNSEGAISWDTCRPRGLRRCLASDVPKYISRSWTRSTARFAYSSSSLQGTGRQSSTRSAWRIVCSCNTRFLTQRRRSSPLELPAHERSWFFTMARSCA